MASLTVPGRHRFGLDSFAVVRALRDLADGIEANRIMPVSAQVAAITATDEWEIETVSFSYYRRTEAGSV